MTSTAGASTEAVMNGLAETSSQKNVAVLFSNCPVAAPFPVFDGMLLTRTVYRISIASAVALSVSEFVMVPKSNSRLCAAVAPSPTIVGANNAVFANPPTLELIVAGFTVAPE